MPKDDDRIIEVRCPECGALIRVPEQKAERDNMAKCPKGHEVPLAKAV